MITQAPAAPLITRRDTIRVLSCSLDRIHMTRRMTRKISRGIVRMTEMRKTVCPRRSSRDFDSLR